MKKKSILLSLVAISFTANAEVQLEPSQTKYCSQNGSVMTIKKADINNFEIVLMKNGMRYTLFAPVSSLAVGGEAEIQKSQQLLLRSTNLISNGTLVKTVNSYSLSTLQSNESMIQAGNILSEISLSSGSKIGVLNSNGTNVFIGSEGLCH